MNIISTLFVLLLHKTGGEAFDKRVGPAVAKAVAEAAKRTGVARI